MKRSQADWSNCRWKASPRATAAIESAIAASGQGVAGACAAS
ncbi:MAG TPA: hypothetical protein VM764_06705 [Gemmatimonadaceae bacterium]|nr:hypothetical protein [Gemmatimonadaceae bacterium]